MNKKLWWAGFSLGLVLSSSACTDVESCTEGDKGCKGGPCDSDNVCAYSGLVCLVDSHGREVCGEKKGDDKFDCGSAGTCTMPDTDAGTGGDGDTGDAGADAGPSEPTCECGGAEEVCAPDTTDTCLNFCEIPDVIPGSEAQLGACKAQVTDANPNPTDPTFAEVCETRCRQALVRINRYCTGANLDPESCTDDAVQTQCETNTDFATNPVAALAALTTSCIENRDAACTDVVCPTGSTLACAGVACKDDCKYNFDGECDDGDLASAVSSACGWGTDCSDCGPRKGPKPSSAKHALGDVCVDDAQCVGHSSSDYTINRSWCLLVDGITEDVTRCMPDCSVSGTCPDGYACLTITVDDEPLMQDGITAQVCNPMVCQ